MTRIIIVKNKDELGELAHSFNSMTVRIREMLKDKAPQMLGEKNMVEVDEAYIGGNNKNRHYNKNVQKRIMV